MEDKNIKKKKLKLSISSKTKINPISYTKGTKTSVVIEKTIYRKKSNVDRGQKSEKNFNRYSDVQKVTQNKNYSSKTATPKKSFEIRKIAEQRATKRFKSPKEEINLEVDVEKIQTRYQGHLRYLMFYRFTETAKLKIRNRIEGHKLIYRSDTWLVYDLAPE